MVLGQQTHVFIVGSTFFAAVDQLLVDRLGRTNLLIAHVKRLKGLLLDVRLAVGQQAIRQHPQAQGQLSELVQGANARHAAKGDVFRRRTDLAHLVQGEHTEKQHQRANQREAEKGPRRDIHITKRHVVILGRSAIHAGFERGVHDLSVIRLKS
eukprot:gene21592-biopygen12138